MTFLPIVFRELRVASRRRATYWSRALTAVAAIAAGVMVFSLQYDRAPHDQAEVLFVTISVGAFIYCLFTGVRSTADCLSEEKREGTLGLLFLTDLKGYDVVGGKLVATSLNSFYGLTAIFPVLAIPLLMGGVTPGEFWRMALVLANTFLLSLAAGMFMSAISQSARRAMAGTFLLLLLSSAGLGFMLLVPAVGRFPFLPLACTALDPASSFVLSFDAQYASAPKLYWWSAGIIHGFGWVFLILASLIVPRSWQDHPAGAAGSRWRERWRRWSYGADAERVEFRRRLLDQNAFFWLAGRARLKPIHVWAALAVLAALWSWGVLEQGNDWTSSFVAGSVVLNTMLKIWTASEAGRRLGEERKLGSLELILTTPLSIPDILRGQMLALRRQFLAPLLLVTLVETVFLVAVLRSSDADAASIPGYIACWVAFTVMLAADIVTLSGVAMWASLTARNPNRATGIAVLRVMVLPDAVWVAILMFGPMFPFAALSDFNWKFLLAAWLLPGILADLVFGLGAWRRLREEFREVAAQRFAPSSSRLFRWLRGNPPAGAVAPNPEAA